VEIPVKAVIPIDQMLTVPLQTPAGEIVLDVPLNTEFSIDSVVPVDVEQTISVESVVQLNTTIPIEIDIAQTRLAGYLKQAKLDIVRLRSRLALQREATMTDETAAIAATDAETRVDSALTPPGDTQSQAVSVEAVVIATATPEMAAQSDTSHGPSPGNLAAQPVSDSCAHAYWPLRPGTAWTFNSPDTSYVQRVDSVSNDQVHLSTQYEGRDMQFSLMCNQEGLGGNYLGDMRRISELGELAFSHPRGVFLPRPEIMEEIGKTWIQEFDVTGTIQASQEDRVVTGRITRGRAVALYTSTDIETTETPLGPRDALRIEQKLDIEMDVDFDLDSQTIPMRENVSLQIAYWFVKGIGPVKVDWQGGLIGQTMDTDSAPVDQRTSVPGLAEERLVFVCVSSEGQSSECLRMAGMSQSDLTVPSASELGFQGFAIVW